MSLIIDPNATPAPEVATTGAAASATPEVGAGTTTPAAETTTTPAAPTSVRDVIAARRAELAAGGTTWAEQQRNADGTFGTKPGAAATDPAATPTADDTTPPAADTPAETDEAPELVPVKLPGRRADDPEIEHPLPPEIAERVAQLRNGYMRGEEIRAARGEIQEQRAQVVAVQSALNLDPVGFLTSAGDDGQPLIPAAHRQELVLSLLASDPQLYESVVTELSTWDRSEAERRAAVAEIEARKAQRASELQQQRDRASRDAEAAEQAAGERSRSIVAAIDALRPADQDADVYRDAAIDRVIEIKNELGLTAEQLTPERVRAILSRYPVAASAAAAAQGATTPATAAGNPAPAAKPAAPPAPAADTGKRLVEARERKEGAAAVVTPGAGAAPLNITPPPNQTVKQRIDWARKNGIFRG
ncbi:MAG TPA: hypothetical protein VGB66_04360 [Longimicrobium sp.]